MPESKILDKFKDEPKVTLGKVEWAIPPLSGRRIIRFGSLANGIAITRGMAEADMMKIYEAVFLGVQQGLEKDALTFDQWLDDYPVTFEEMLAALPTIGKQAGMDIAVKAPGEALAEPRVDNLSSTTGTTS
jgi:hypothetical protein